MHLVIAAFSFTADVMNFITDRNNRDFCSTLKSYRATRGGRGSWSWSVSKVSFGEHTLQCRFIY